MIESFGIFHIYRIYGGHILEKIAVTKRREVEALKRLIPAEELRLRAMGAACPVNSMKYSISERKFAIIAEHKRRTPSKGEISPMSEVGDVAEAYLCNGAAAMSVLTDTSYFGGSLDDLATAWAMAPRLPLLRKEFIVDEYQLFQARIFGADAVLLIASMLDGETLRSLHAWTGDSCRTPFCRRTFQAAAGCRHCRNQQPGPYILQHRHFKLYASGRHASCGYSESG
ncbi:MAG: hypothetical protein K2J58_04285 [Muribaculaceae bacterium]|nr:hypothetical protein [Muribaculaceae bacterium]